MDGSECIAAWKRLQKNLVRLRLAHIEYEINPEPPEPGRFEPATELETLLPDDYLDFVEEVGYRTIALDQTDGPSFTFLPPEWVAEASTAMGVPDRPWADVAEERENGEHEYKYAFFGGWDMADVNGWAFGMNADNEPVVWLVEDSLPFEDVGTFSEWLTERLEEIIEHLEELDEDALELLRDAHEEPVFDGL